MPGTGPLSALRSLATPSLVSMRGQLSQQQQKDSEELRFLIQKSSGSVTSGQLKDFLREVSKQCPWYPEGGSFHL